MRHRKSPRPDPHAATPAPALNVQPSQPADLGVVPGGIRLGELLVDAGLATREHVVTALESAQRGSGKRLGDLLVELGSLDDRALAHGLAKQRALDVADLRQITPEPAAIDLMTEAMARALTAIPLVSQRGFGGRSGRRPVRDRRQERAATQSASR